MKKGQEGEGHTYELIKNLKSPDDNVKTQSISQLPQIFQVLGPKRLVNELLPYLQDLLDEDEDIVLSLCKSLSYIQIPANDRSAFSGLTKFFEEMTAFEEASIRDESIKSIIRVLANMPKEIRSTNAATIVTNLIATDTNLKKEAAAKLLDTFSEFLLPNDYKNIIDWTKELLKDGNSETIYVITCKS